MGKSFHLYLFGFFIMEDLHGMGLPYISPIPMSFFGASSSYTCLVTPHPDSGRLCLNWSSDLSPPLSSPPLFSCFSLSSCCLCHGLFQCKPKARTNSTLNLPFFRKEMHSLLWMGHCSMLVKPGAFYLDCFIPISTHCCPLPLVFWDLS